MSSSDNRTLTTKEKLRPISGFPELLPEHRIVELEWIDKLRSIFESYGFTSIEPRSIEPVEVLLKQGDTDKEIYTIGRLLDSIDTNSEPTYALHYDMTVPMARYVAANMNQISFPFKRYQIQKAWRGERPQDGRFREFLQCDIDVVDTRDIPLHFDSEIPIIMQEAVTAIGAGPLLTKINNRKILEGFYAGIGIKDTSTVIRIIDKLDKIGPHGVDQMLTKELSLDTKTVNLVLKLAQIKGSEREVIGKIQSLDVTSELLDQGLRELEFVMQELEQFDKNSFSVDLSIARGLAYYTGTVYESRFMDFPDFPTICGGGRYDNLVGDFANKKLPGIGISIGLSRIFSKLLKENRITANKKSPTEILVIYSKGAPYGLIRDTARTLRQRGYNVEQYHEDRKLNIQLKYAADKMIPWIWFPPDRFNGEHQVKNSLTREQEAADPTTWIPT
ncbi:MAG: histidine--tRNA ligase [Rhodospirillaceae bacterium]|nr:histidine--tRNA ligase [Rhodospirillaceae bacterium]